VTLQQLGLIAFAAGSVIHGAQAFLIWKTWRDAASARTQMKEGIAVCLVAFFWQLGNFWRELGLTFHPIEPTSYLIGTAMAVLSLLSFPLLFSYSIANICGKSRTAELLVNIGSAGRYPLFLFFPVSAVSLIMSLAGRKPFIDPGFAQNITLYVMLLYFALFLTVGVINGRVTRDMTTHPERRANRAGTIAAFLGFATFVFMLAMTGTGRNSRALELAAMMTSVPFTVAIAYRLYQFPFMDAFLREVLSGVILLGGVCIGFAAGPQSDDLLPVRVAAVTLLLAFAKDPVSRWVDRTFLGYAESVEEEEERIGNALRGLTRFSDFSSRASEILRHDLDSDWVNIGEEPSAEAVLNFQIPGSPSMWLSLGPRKGARSYMSRQVRVAKRAVLELAAQYHLLQQHDLKESTARAQIRALQAQINPHFLFNTLNVLASLIHSDSAKAEQVIEDLAEVFRYALESTRREWVKLDDELRFIESYLQIEQTRFEDRLKYTFDVDPEIRSVRIPPMILQPLVENAVRHGISPNIAGGSVRVAASLDRGRMIITVDDTGAEIGNVPRRGSGIGLANIRERLAHIYGERAVLRLEKPAVSGTRAVLILPYDVEVPV